MVSNANNTGVVAYLKFDHKPDGRLEARYQFLGLMEGLSEPSSGRIIFGWTTSRRSTTRYASSTMI